MTDAPVRVPAMTTHRSTRTLLILALVSAGLIAHGGRHYTPADARVAAPRKVTPSTTASCYGPGFYGRHTADGTTMTEGGQFVAHRTLPFGTRVAIAANGVRVVTTVKDRGPFHRNARGQYDRTWDVSNGLAVALGFADCYAFGVRSVRVTVLP